MKLTSINLVYALVAVLALVVMGSLVTSWVAMQSECRVGTSGGSPLDTPVGLASVPSSLPVISSSLPVNSGSQAPLATVPSHSEVPCARVQGPVANPTSAVPFVSVPQVVSGGEAPPARHDNPSDGNVSSSTTDLSSRVGVSSVSQAANFSTTGVYPMAPSAASPSISAGGSAPAAVNVPIPAAFGNPAAAGISSPDQAQQAAQIANDFTAQVQASGVSPSSPAYQNVWNSAANKANALFKQQFGWQAFEAMQRSARGQ